jgi:LPXTG-motif cell wall-anchored protein
VALTPIVYSIKYPMIVGFILVLAGFSLVRKRKKDHKDNITAPSTKGKNRSQ